jgi:Undecaprenyl-phosphate galactose phosphotransferase WbaP
LVLTLKKLVSGIVLGASDVIALSLALYISLDIEDLSLLAGTPQVLSLWMQQDTASHFIAYMTSASLVIYWLWTRGHYVKRIPFWSELGQLLGIVFTGFFTEIGLTVLLSHQPIAWSQVVGAWAAALLLIPFLRLLTIKLLLLIGLWRQSVIIVGVGENARAAFSALNAESLLGYSVRSFARLPGTSVGSGNSILEIDGRQFPVVDLDLITSSAMQSGKWDQVVIALDQISGNEESINQIGAVSTNVLVFPSIRGLPMQGVEVSHFFGRELLMLRIQNSLLRRGPRFAKRVFDIFGSIVLLVVLAPLFLLFSLLIRRDGAPAIYGHLRVGSNGNLFKCLKFRSMVANSDEVLKNLLDADAEARAEWDKDFKLKKDPRVTQLGAFLRKSSLDELPQLFNVLKGDMSLVGPRPVVSEEIERYAGKVAYYLQVRPGITGLWQVSGRNDVDYATRVDLDVWYVKNWSLWTDIVILLKTVKVVAFRVGAY